jgi:CRISPR-associated endonuclease Csn1
MQGEAATDEFPGGRYRLGLDIGANSVGWAAIRLDGVDAEQGHPCGILAAGVRIFEAGVDGSIEQGKDSSRAVTRRVARQQRRQTWRRQFRKRRLFVCLQRLGLLPASDDSTSVGRDLVLKQLDAELAIAWCPAGDVDAHQKLPYALRSAAAARLLEPCELGRAIYHLGQRRGYKANRRSPEAGNDEGAVSGGISVLNQARLRDPQDSGSLRSLARMVVEEFGQQDGVFAIRSEALDSPRRGRIRGHYTAREMYEQEFAAIRDFQLNNGGPLTAEDWAVIRGILFTQRPLKSQRHLVGRCTLEKDRGGRGRRRCLMALPEFQEFRVLQTLNHLAIRNADDTEERLTEGQRAVLYDWLMREGDLKLNTRAARGKPAAPSVVSLLNLPKNTRFSLRSADESEEDDERLIGDRTSAKFSRILGPLWDQLSAVQKEKLILQVVYAGDPERLAAWVARQFGFSDEMSSAVARLSLEDEHASLSRRAIRKLLPLLRAGETYAAARKAIYPESFLATKAVDLLPPVTRWNREINNPAVIRALTEVRRVVNSIIRRFGKPETIHVELARDLKRSRQERKTLWAQNDQNRKDRDRAKVRILQQLGNSSPSRADVEKWLLAEECNWTCPYTGRGFSAATLKDFDVEHIYPRQYLDDSFANKTLCDPDFNRMRKRNRLPSEILDGDELQAVISRVRSFNGRHAEAKLRRFLAESVPEGFVDRQLNDTRYNSRLASEFLGTLYGGRNDADRRQRIVTPTGGLTWLIRRGFGLDRILGSADQKERGDHRHHAVDAVCVALSTQKVIQRLSGLASEFSRPGNRFNEFLAEFSKELPWPEFQTDTASAVREIVVSHRPERSIAGGLHGETSYSKPFAVSPAAGGERRGGRRATGLPEHRVRKSLDKLKKDEIEGDGIVDPAVRAAVQAKFAELVAAASSPSAATPEKFWNNRALLDRFPRLLPSARKREGGSNSGGSIIFSVRMRARCRPATVGRGPRKRYVAPATDSNFATMIYELRGSDGTVIRWDHEVISRLDAHQRLVASRANVRIEADGTHAAKQSSGVEKILIPRTADEIRAIEEPPFRLKPGEQLFYVCTLRKNDMIELDGSSGDRTVYRVQNLSTAEIQLCEHHLQTMSGSDRNKTNRITAIDNLRKRSMRCLNVSPSGELG